MTAPIRADLIQNAFARVSLGQCAHESFEQKRRSLWPMEARARSFIGRIVLIRQEQDNGHLRFASCFLCPFGREQCDTPQDNYTMVKTPPTARADPSDDAWCIQTSRGMGTKRRKKEECARVRWRTRAKRERKRTHIYACLSLF
jgi:hypothetical protein